MAENFFDQFDSAKPQDGAENFFDRFDTSEKPKVRQISIPVPGGGSFTPSLIGMAKGLFEGAKSAVTAPGDVYAGRLDPFSDEGIHRAMDTASLIALPSAGRTIAATAKVTPTVAELKTSATPTYQALTEAGNTVPVVGKEISSDIAEILHPEALRPANAPRTYREITRLSGSKDLNDVAIARDKLRDVANGISENKLIRVAGEDSTAARTAMGALDKKIEDLSPGWTGKMAEADANWAAAKRIEKVQKEADKGQKGRLGSFDTNETRAKGYTPDELAAIKRAHQGGMLGTGLNALGSLSPFHGGITGAVSAAMHLPAALASGGLSLAGIPLGMGADALAKALRNKALRQAIEKIASRSPLAVKNPSRGILQLPQISVSPTLGLLPLQGQQRP